MFCAIEWPSLTKPRPRKKPVKPSFRRFSMSCQFLERARMTRNFYGCGRKGPLNTLLERGDQAGRLRSNRFNGFRQGEQTVETVRCRCPVPNTPLKQGVNESQASACNLIFETSSLAPQSSAFKRRDFLLRMDL